MIRSRAFPILLAAAVFLATFRGPPARADGPAPVASGQRVFSCGHSFHGYVPAMLEEIAKSAGYRDHQIAGTSIIGGSKVNAYRPLGRCVQKTRTTGARKSAANSAQSD